MTTPNHTTPNASTITAEHFEERVGSPPEQDDLERCNCPKAGQLGHFSCGWNTKKDMPVFMTGPQIQDTYPPQKW